MPRAELEPAVLIVDQGGHASRAFVFDARGRLLAMAERPIRARKPDEVRAEYDGAELWRQVAAAVQKALAAAPVPLAAAGLATQRSNVACWDRENGAPLGPVLSWQDRRAWRAVEALRAHEAWIHERTGLFLTPHYGASKLRWCLDHLPAVRRAHEEGRLGFGPMAAWLAGRLAGGAARGADVVNAGRTQLVALKTRDWDDALLNLFGVPRKPLPPVVPNAWGYGSLAAAPEVPLALVTGDQNAALFAYGELDEATAYTNAGTGAFVLRATGKRLVMSERLLSGVLYQDGKRVEYVLEGTVNGAGSALAWFERTYGVEDLTGKLEGWLRRVPVSPLVFLNGVSGLGSPFWRAHFPVRFEGEGGLAEKAAAVVESIVFLLAVNLEEQARYLPAPARIRLTGGLANLDGLAQRLADLTGLVVERPPQLEATARGTAFLLAGRPADWDPGGAPDVFEPRKNPGLEANYARWRNSIEHHLKR
ncbi:FGGY family carbohydrate kinase [Deinococcota bacterium DY0809b]